MLYRPLSTEGTLVCPQHMQQQDAYHERHLTARLGAIAAHPWGVLALRFDPAALQAGQLALSYLRAVLLDGAAVDLDDDSPQRPAAQAIAPPLPGPQRASVRPLRRPEPAPRHRQRRRRGRRLPPLPQRDPGDLRPHPLPQRPRHRTRRAKPRIAPRRRAPRRPRRRPPRTRSPARGAPRSHLSPQKRPHPSSRDRLTREPEFPLHNA